MMDMICPASAIRAVISMSGSLGSGSPEGWLWAKLRLDEFSYITIH